MQPWWCNLSQRGVTMCWPPQVADMDLDAILTAATAGASASLSRARAATSVSPLRAPGGATAAAANPVGGSPHTPSNRVGCVWGVLPLRQMGARVGMK